MVVVYQLKRKCVLLCPKLVLLVHGEAITQFYQDNMVANNLYLYRGELMLEHYIRALLKLVIVIYFLCGQLGMIVLNSFMMHGIYCVLEIEFKSIRLVFNSFPQHNRIIFICSITCLHICGLWEMEVRP